MIALLVDGPLAFRPNQLIEVLNSLDEAHSWTHTQPELDGDDAVSTADTLGLICSGPHGGIMTVMNLDLPLKPVLVEEARVRSWWYGEAERAAGHRTHWVIAGGQAEGWEAAVLRAKVSTVIAAMLIKDNPSICAVWNGVNGTLFTPDSVMQDLGFVARGQVPVMFWIFNALHDLTDGNVSMSTGGLVPFVGYELEFWNAPRSKEVVVEQLNGVLNYLLAMGPIIQSGQTIGMSGGAETLRCDFGPSRTERNAPTTALQLTFVDGPAAAKSKPSFLGKLFGRA